MRIAARMALQAPTGIQTENGRGSQISAPQTTIRALGFHGIDVIVSAISENGFVADAMGRYAADSVVRLRLPGLGCVYATIVWSRRGKVCGRFITPIQAARLQRMLGLDITVSDIPALAIAAAG